MLTAGGVVRTFSCACAAGTRLSAIRPVKPKRNMVFLIVSLKKDEICFFMNMFFKNEIILVSNGKATERKAGNQRTMTTVRSKRQWLVFPSSRTKIEARFFASATSSLLFYHPKPEK